MIPAALMLGSWQIVMPNSRSGAMRLRSPSPAVETIAETWGEPTPNISRRKLPSINFLKEMSNGSLNHSWLALGVSKRKNT